MGQVLGQGPGGRDTDSIVTIVNHDLAATVMTLKKNACSSTGLLGADQSHTLWLAASKGRCPCTDVRCTVTLQLRPTRTMTTTVGRGATHREH